MIWLSLVPFVKAIKNAPILSVVVIVFMFDYSLTSGGNVFINVNPIMKEMSTLYTASIREISILNIIVVSGLFFVFLFNSKNLPLGISCTFLPIIFLSTLTSVLRDYSLYKSAYFSLPWVTTYLFAIIGYQYYSSEVNSMKTMRILLCVVLLKTLLGVIFLVNGNYIYDSNLGTRIVFFDWITAYVSLCFLVAVAALRYKKVFVIPIIFLVLVLQILSLRRTVILSVVVIVFVFIVKFKGQKIRILLFSCFILSVLTLSAALNLGSTQAAFRFLNAGLKTFQGEGNDMSIKGHLQDIKVGLQLISEFGFFGLDQERISSTSTLVVRKPDSFYIHNEFLQQWVFNGVLGLLFTLLLFLACFVVALSRINLSKNIFGLMARVYFIGLPAILIFSSDFSNSPRTQIITGLFMGILFKEKKSFVRVE